MRILLTNDDGIFASGLSALYKELVRIGEVVVVAPSESQSGASHRITFKNPLVCNKVQISGEFSGYSVDGSPADCVKLAYMELVDGDIDLLVAGLNNGANVGINIYYSGTVAAAMEGSFLGLPSVAMSVAAEEHVDFQSAAQYCMGVLKKVIPIQKSEVININIPQLSKGKPKGVKVVPQSTEGFEESYVCNRSGDGKLLFQLTGGTHRFEESRTDTMSLSEGFITVTSLASGMTDYSKNKRLEQIEW